MSREPKSMILCESVKQTSQIYDLMMVAYSVSTQRAYASRASAMMGNSLANGLVIYLIVPYLKVKPHYSKKLNLRLNF